MLRRESWSSLLAERISLERFLKGEVLLGRTRLRLPYFACSTNLAAIEMSRYEIHRR